MIHVSLRMVPRRIFNWKIMHLFQTIYQTKVTFLVRKYFLSEFIKVQNRDYFYQQNCLIFQVTTEGHLDK